MSKPKQDPPTQLQVIRTETVLSKFPVHNLSKQKKASIRISRKNEHGKTDLYWEVSPHKKYGPPGELAYKIDTLIINKRIDELPRPLPEIFRLGTQSWICEQLGQPPSGKNTTAVKKALRQNAGASISADIKYKGKDGTQQRIEADFTRYGVIFTGETLPNGETADAVYIILNEPMRGVLNTAPFRPLNYNYLKQLKPTAQRFYEIISYRIFAAINHNQSQAKLLYSEYCMFSAQARYYDYNRFKKQMYKIHKPHQVSDYIKKVSYDETKDAEGLVDWLMCYTPGTKAKAEYKAFNGKQRTQDGVIEVKKPKAAKKPKPKPCAAPVTPGALPEASTMHTSTPSPALELVQAFHKLVRGIDNYQPYTGGKEQSQAQTLLTTYGLERANFVVTYAIAEARKTNFVMRTFGAIFQYLSEAIAQYERQAQEQERQRTQEVAQRQETNARLAALSRDQYRDLYNKIKKLLLRDLPSLANNPEGLESLIKTEMIMELNHQAAREKQ